MVADRYRTLSGVSLVGGGVLTVLGFVTAEAMYPGYSTSSQTISALGAAGAPSASQAVFNGTMVLVGVLLLVVAAALHQVYDQRSVPRIFAVTAAGVAGVGLFPAQTGLPHFLAATLAFGGMGLSALVVAATVRGPFRYLSVGLGSLELVALALFVALGDGTPLGIGGLERWVAYAGVLWTTAFGGFLLADESSHG